MAVTMFEAWALNPPMLPAIALPIIDERFKDAEKTADALKPDTDISPLGFWT